MFAQSNLPACPPSGYLNNCFGSYTYPSGNQYVGEFRADKRDGLGTFYSSSGSVISQGVWAYDHFISEKLVVQTSLINQSAYAQEVQPFKAQSKLPACPSSGYFGYCFGEYKYPSGNKYLGEFKADKRDGLGTFYDSNGAVIKQGIWSFDNFVSAVQILQAAVPLNAELTVGAYLQSSLPTCKGNTVPKWTDCYGVQTWGNDDVKYIGEYKSGLHHGRGVLFLAGEKYEGDFDSGVFNGVGSFTTSAGVKFVGEFKFGKWHGLGIEYAPNGVVLRSGRWTNGNFFNAFEIETSRFPFKSLPQLSTASLKPVITDEFEKLRSEAEEAKRKQAEAEIGRAHV